MPYERLVQMDVRSAGPIIQTPEFTPGGTPMPLDSTRNMASNGKRPKLRTKHEKRKCSEHEDGRGGEEPAAKRPFNVRPEQPPVQNVYQRPFNTLPPALDQPLAAPQEFSSSHSENPGTSMFTGIGDLEPDGHKFLETLMATCPPPFDVKEYWSKL